MKEKRFFLLFILLQVHLSFSDVNLGDFCDCDRLIPFGWDCTKYYECASFQLFIRDCPAGLHFNEALQQCVYATQSTCNEDSICEPTT